MKVRKYTFHELVKKDKYPASIEDMLRYDGAFINPKLPGLLLLPHWHGARSNITVARWITFGYWVSDSPQVIVVEPNDWYTYITIRGSLRSVTLEEHLQAKNWDAIYYDLEE